MRVAQAVGRLRALSKVVSNVSHGLVPSAGQLSGRCVAARRWQSGLRDDWEWDPQRDAGKESSQQTRAEELSKPPRHVHGVMKRIPGENGKDSWQLLEEVEVEDELGNIRHVASPTDYELASDRLARSHARAEQERLRAEAQSGSRGKSAAFQLSKDEVDFVAAGADGSAVAGGQLEEDAAVRTAAYGGGAGPGSAVEGTRPEEVGRRLSAGLDTLRPEEREKVLNDPYLQRMLTGTGYVSSLDWDPSVRTPRAMPFWMLFEMARSEGEETDGGAAGGGASRKQVRMEQTLIRAPRRSSRGWAGARGARKTAQANVLVRLGDGSVSVNRKRLDEVFPLMEDRREALSPLLTLGIAGAFDVRVDVKGGGPSGQAGAVKHGLARALARFDPGLQPQLKRLGMLRRDPRMVERKKPGRKKARKKFQWVKR